MENCKENMHFHVRAQRDNRMWHNTSNAGWEYSQGGAYRKPILEQTLKLDIYGADNNVNVMYCVYIIAL